ncbi:alpha/beta fold hydrolase [Radicibacter daui]|uniref:alpha/beta fold hydrolase n=1 Tax=Radicibacter daui TaxID=3064829 RepID=UPI004046BDB7
MTHMTIPTGSADSSQPWQPGPFWKIFSRRSVRLPDVHLNFVEGGAGEPLLLIPGWPQSWYTWRHVMPLLAQAGRRVIALDPRGLGDSSRPAGGYDLGTVAGDIRQFMTALGIDGAGPVDVAGHDIGAWIGYALAAEHPDAVRRLAVFDSALPGISEPPPPGIPAQDANVKTWHFGFNRLDDLPEILLAGREREFLSWLFAAKATRREAIAPDDLAEYVRVNSLPGAIRSAMAYYRAALSAEGLAANRQRGTRKLAIPVLAFGADNGVGLALLNTMKLVADNVSGGVFTSCGHYMPEEAPRAVAEQLLGFMPT